MLQIDMKRRKNGMIVFLRDQVFPGPKLLDIVLTNTFPLISLSKETILLFPSGKKEILRDFDHIAIPPDFRLHMSSQSEHVFFDAQPVWDFLKDETSKKPFHYFSFFGLPSRITQDLVKPGKTKTWNQAVVVSPFQDKQFNKSTRLFIDFFLHHPGVDIDLINNYPFIVDGQRLASDQHGSILGPYSLDGIQRRNQPIGNLYFTIRFGFADIEDNESVYVYSSLEIFQRRSRN